MERGSVIDAQITLNEEEEKLWKGIEDYKESSIESQDPITGIIKEKDNRVLLRGLQRRKY